MPKSSDPDKSHLFKPTWNNKETKVIRVPVAFADALLDIAHKIDDGEPPEAVYRLVMQTTVALNWDQCAALVQAAIQDIPLPQRLTLREALLRLFSSAYVYKQYKTLTQPTTGLLWDLEKKTVSVDLKEPVSWQDCVVKWAQVGQQTGLYTQLDDSQDSETLTSVQTVAIQPDTKMKIAGLAIRLLDLAATQPKGKRTVDGKTFYSFIEQGHQLSVLAPMTDLNPVSYTVLQLWVDFSKDPVQYRIDTPNLKLHDIERFAVAAHYLRGGLQHAASPEEETHVAHEVLKLL